MNCQSFESIVNDLAREQIMEAQVREQALAHSGECEVCALSLADQRALTQQLRTLATEMNRAEAPSRIQEELRRAFLTQTIAQPQVRATSIGRYWIIAAAAVLLIVFGIAGVRLRSAFPSDQKASAPQATSPPQDSTAVIKSSSDTLSVKDVVAGTRSRSRTHRLLTHSAKRESSARLPKPASTTTAMANSTKSEVATAFMPLGYMSAMNLQDGGQIVRVELPRSAMVSLGLPVNMDRLSERVKADVLVGADGLARAIRFVQ